ncbi:MAG: hypothetical protein EA358_00825 [Flavobacteriales bacterium]|nr:MAG: hypothetical protein EA358_00825 [Flavobacteriales bacterium]
MKYSTKSILLGFAITALSLSLIQCSKDDDDTPTPQRRSTIQFSLDVTANNQSVDRGTPFSIDTLFDFMISDLKFYYSNVELKNEAGEWVSAEPSVRLIDWRNFAAEKHRLTIKPGTYTAIRYHVGLDSATNRTFPTDPSLSFEDPLSAAQGTHWNWNLFYRFIIVEGRVNNFGSFITDPQSPVQNTPFSIHPGTDEMLVINEQNFTTPISLDNGDVTNMTFVVNTNTWPNGPGGVQNLITENQGHAEPHDYEITKKFGANFASGLSVRKGQ